MQVSLILNDNRESQNLNKLKIAHSEKYSSLFYKVVEMSFFELV